MISVDRLPIASPAESNVFLRSLWATLRSNFGKLGWQYTPHKFGPQQRIRFGWMTLGASSPDGVEVSIRYGKIGVIRQIEFEMRADIEKIHPNLGTELRRCVAKAVERMATPETFGRSTQVSSDPPVTLGYYKGKDWYCGPLTNGNSEVGMDIRAFDEVDADHEFAVRIAPLLDVLACMTNVVLDTVWDTDGEQAASVEQQNIFLTDDGWLDDIPVKGGDVQLSADAVEFCGGVVAGSMVADRLIRAASLFHKALTLYRKVPKCNDVATALFMSALETVDLTPEVPDTCDKCGQPTYKISKRVVDLGVKHLGPGVERIFKDHYNHRSQYLHAGIVRSSQPLQGHIIPQLDSKGHEGCAMPWVIGGPANLLEFTSFVIRREMLDTAAPPV